LGGNEETFTIILEGELGIFRTRLKKKNASTDCCAVITRIAMEGPSRKRCGVKYHCSEKEGPGKKGTF